jgi:hypothetical protein
VRSLRRFAGSFAVLVLFFGLLAGPAHAAIFIVNSTGDGGDATVGDGFAGPLLRSSTLRAAIQEANFAAGADTINFNIAPIGGVKTITPATALLQHHEPRDHQRHDPAEPPLRQPLTIQLAARRRRERRADHHRRRQLRNRDPGLIINRFTAANGSDSHPQLVE